MEMMTDVWKGVMMVATKDLTAEVLMDDLSARTMGGKGVAMRAMPMAHELERKWAELKAPQLDMLTV